MLRFLAPSTEHFPLVDLFKYTLEDLAHLGKMTICAISGVMMWDVFALCYLTISHFFIFPWHSAE